MNSRIKHNSLAVLVVLFVIEHSIVIEEDTKYNAATDPLLYPREFKIRRLLAIALFSMWAIVYCNSEIDEAYSLHSEFYTGTLHYALKCELFRWK